MSMKQLLWTKTKCPPQHIHVTDRHLDLITREELDEFLMLDKTNEIPYVGEKFDCDDYALRLWYLGKTWFRAEKNKNAAIGYVITEGHALNICVLQGPPIKVVWVEPQTDQVVPIHSRPKLIIM